jgi:predicted amidophosphoribosyltransferase
MTPPIPHESIIDEAPSAPRPIAPRMSAAPRPLDPEAVTPKRPSRPGCKYCGQTLPDGREIVFCPNCGQNLLVRRCAACSAELEPGWKFCVACGRASSP